MPHDSTPSDRPDRDDVAPGDEALLRLVDGVLFSGTPESAAPVNVEAALAAVRARMAIDAHQVQPVVMTDMAAHPLRPTLTVSRAIPATATASHVTPNASRRWKNAVGLAAAAAVVVTAGLGIWRGRASTADATSPVAAALAPTVHETRVGVRDSVVLADGSRVVLAPGSRLTVAADFATTRVVDLDGAAFFSVKHDAAHPFTVRSNGAEIRDVGTAFSVTGGGTGQVRVAVTEGVVALRPVRGSEASVELRAGDRGTVTSLADAVPSVSVQRGIVTPADVAWTRGELTYRDTPLSDVQADLRRWYGVRLEFADAALAARTLTASLRGDDLTQALQIISTALGTSMTRSGDTVTLRSDGRGTP